MDIYTVAGKEQFITELCDRVRDEVLALVPKMPATWDGHELRALIAEHFDGASFGFREHKRTARYKDYRNACITRNLF